MFPEDTIFFPDQPDNISYKVSWWGKVYYKLRRPYFYSWKRNGVDAGLLINKGYRNDGASVGRLLQTVSGLHQDSMRVGAIPHDAGYEAQGVFPQPYATYYELTNGEWLPKRTVLTKLEADRDLLYHALTRTNFPSHLSLRAYMAVKVGGHMAWHTD